MVWRAAVDGEARIFAGRGGFFASSEVRLVRRLGGPAVVPFAAAGFWDPLRPLLQSCRVALCELAADALVPAVIS